MSYLVLARKYRPRTFADVAGQEVATRVLQGALREGRIGHAYLFSGPRGTGKTTSARIFAKALNCEQGPTPEPCGTCARCVATDTGSEVDIIEIDAASNRGIDDARALRDEVAYAPMSARFKVYIVDEVHMLTKEAFNALLKTLEEPPAHVKFLFATTEPHKVIETIRSRCQMVQLSLIKEETIASTLEGILAQEGIEAEAGVVQELARQARGSMRDALSLTDQLLALVGQTPKVEDVRRLAGPASSDLIGELSARMRDHDQAGILATLSRLEGGETEIAGALLEHLRLALVSVLAPEEAAVLVPDEARRQDLVALAKQLGPARVQIWLQELLAARERMAVLPEHARVVLEVTLLDLAREDATMPLGELAGRLMALEARLGGAPAPIPGAVPPPAPNASPSAPQAAAPSAPPAAAPSSPQAAAPSSPQAAAPAAPQAAAPRSAPGDAPHSAPAPEARAHPQAQSQATQPAAPEPAPVPPPPAAPLAEVALGTATAVADPEPAPQVPRAAPVPPAPRAAPAPPTERGTLTPQPSPTAASKRNQPSRGGRKTIDTGRIEWTGKRPPPPPPEDDTFTQAVTDLFTGKLES